MKRSTFFLLLASLAMSSVLAAKPLANAQPSSIDIEKKQQIRQHLRTADLETKINYLLDRAEIQDLITTYGYSADVRDWKLHQSVFTETYEDGTSGVFRKNTSAKRIEGLEKFFEKFEGIQHLNIPLFVQIEGDNAFAISTLNARHFHSDGTPDKNTLLTGQYEFWCTRTDKGWKISRMNAVNRRKLSMESTIPKAQ